MGERENLLRAQFVNKATGETIKGSYMVIFQYVMNLDGSFGFVVMICVMMSVMLTVFFGYHFYIAMSAATTNERQKTADFGAYLKVKLMYLEKLESGMTFKEAGITE